MRSIASLTSMDRSHDPVLQSIQHIDHITYAGKRELEEEFLQRWGLLGFEELQRLETIRFPATHIALVSGVTKDFPWATMTGLSTSSDEKSPVNEFIRRYGEGVQHVAYNIDPWADMHELQASLKKLGWSFMTPVLTYEDGEGARLRQMFTAPTAPYGTFVELVQRLEGRDGSAFNGFDIENIDDLYQHYEDYSLWLVKNSAA